MWTLLFVINGDTYVSAVGLVQQDGEPKWEVIDGRCSRSRLHANDIVLIEIFYPAVTCIQDALLTR